MAGAGKARRSVDHTNGSWVPPPTPNVPTQHWCDSCGCRLDKEDRPCPFGPHEEVAS